MEPNLAKFSYEFYLPHPKKRKHASEVTSFTTTSVIMCLYF